MIVGQTSFDTMNSIRIPLLAVVAILLFLLGCEVVGTYVMAVSGPSCGQFGEPPELAKMAGIDSNPGMDSPDWADWAIPILEKYEHTRNPEILFVLAYAYLRKSGELDQDSALNRRAVDLLTLSAMCGEGKAASLLGAIYIEGLTGVEPSPELGACLREVYDPEIYERSLIPGRAWACGLRMESVPE